MQGLCSGPRASAWHTLITQLLAFGYYVLESTMGKHLLYCWEYSVSSVSNHDESDFDPLLQGLTSVICSGAPYLGS